MSKTMKWIVGIVISLVILAALVSAGFLVAGRWTGPGWNADARAEKSWEGGRAMPRQEMPGRGMRGQELRGQELPMRHCNGVAAACRNLWTTSITAGPFRVGTELARHLRRCRQGLCPPGWPVE